jgi:hypothetical protein
MKRTGNAVYQAIGTLLLFLCLSCSSTETSPENFERQKLDIKHYGIFDLGVADMNDDGRLDIFTVNHSGLQSLLINSDSQGFTDVYSAWKFDQDHKFPGLAVIRDEPAIEKPGVYINWVGPDVVVRTLGKGDDLKVSGKIEVHSPVKILEKKNFTVQVRSKENKETPNVSHSTLEFTGQGTGRFSFRPFNHALPFQFSFDSGIDPKTIHVGDGFRSPESSRFAFMLRDRHGMAWADYNNDDRMDVFVTRGGENGLMGKLPMPFWDELYTAASDHMEDIGTSVGLSKDGCPGRQAGWVDYNGDSLLDIYVGCGRHAESHPNKLYRQTSDGRFQEVAELCGIDLPDSGSFVWLDVDEDGDMDLFWTGPSAFTLYKNDAGIFWATNLGAHRRKGIRGKPTLSDYDNDGDIDIFSASARGNTLFENRDGELLATSPASVGLPMSSVTADWVDFDNDGMMDMHTTPGKLYVQKDKGRFAAYTRFLAPKSKSYPYRFSDARVTWFDADNNGTRDLLVASEWKKNKRRLASWLAFFRGSNKRLGKLGYFWEVDFFKNNNQGNHWLQVELKGPPGNRPAIGAKVSLSSENGKHVQQVGVSDGSRYSQGHYRLYFGLGQVSAPITLRVDWPDGKSTEIAGPSPDQLLKIDWTEG